MGRAGESNQVDDGAGIFPALLDLCDDVAAPARVAGLSSRGVQAEPLAENLWITARGVGDQARLEEALRGGWGMKLSKREGLWFR